MANRFANPSPQFFDNSGEPLSGGLLYFYETGTSTPATTYSDDDLTTPNTNPVVLDSAGRAGNIFLDPSVTYKAVLKSSDGGTTFWTRDPVVDPAANVAAAVAVYNGDPNGSVAGNAGSVGGSGASLVYDITNERLYVCITTGNAAAAVWQYIYDPISGQEDVRTSDHTVTAANRGRTQVANKASAITFTLPAVATTGAGFVVPVKNIGAGALTIDGNASETIDGATTITLGQYESAILYCNGAAWRTLGRSAGFSDSAEATIASATTTNVLGSTALVVNITGATTITSLGTGPNKVKVVRFSGALTLTHNATSLILPGGANITTAAGDTMIVVSDASSNARVVSYLAAAVAPKRAAFSAHKNSSDQTISTATPTKITFGSEAFDNGGLFDASTDYRWTPPAGIVLIMAKVYIGSLNTTDDINLLLYKNGSLHKYLDAQNGNGTNIVHLTGMTIESVNGTDYFELFIDSSSDTNYNVEGDANLTWFCGSML